MINNGLWPGYRRVSWTSVERFGGRGFVFNESRYLESLERLSFVQVNRGA